MPARMIDRSLASLSPATRWFVINAGLALAYYFTAQLGMALSIGPLHIAAIWPPSGIALAAFMLLGTRALPGLLVGVMAMNVFTFLGPGLGWGLATWLGALALATGSLGQAALIAHVLRTVPERLEAAPVRQTLNFSLVVGAGCLIAPTVGQAVLQALGLMPHAAAFFSWLTWWIGDVTGMLVLAPVALLALHAGLVGKRVAVQAFPILCMGLGLTLFATLSISVMDRDVHAERFRSDGTRLAMALQNHLDMAERDLEILQRSFYKVALTADEFRAVTGPMLDRSPWQQDFAYLPLVLAWQRDGFETSNGAMSLREISPRDTVVRAGPRPEYFPVLWTDPEAGHDALVGIDHLADPQRGPAIRLARQTGHDAGSAPLHSLAKSATVELVQVIYAPLSGLDIASNSPYDADHVRGMVAATIDMGQLLHAVIAQMEVPDHHLLMYDPDAPTSFALERVPSGELRAVNQAERSLALTEMTGGIHHEVGLRVADRHWTLLMQPAWATLAPQPGWLQLGVLASGLAFTALLTGFMVARRRHDTLVRDNQRALETQVQQRTRELATSNQSLRDEVAVRQRAEQQLYMFRWLAESAHQGLGICELDGRVAYLNPALRNMAQDPDWTPGSNRMMQDYLGRRFRRVFDDEVLPTLRSRGFWDGEWHIEPRPGRAERWLAQSHFVLKDDLGQPIYMASLITDITAQRQAEEQLRVFRWFAESAQVGFGIADFDFRMVYMNPALRRMTNHPDWQPGDPRPMLDYLGQRFRQRFLDEAMPVLRAGGVWQGEMHTRPRDGRPEGWYAQGHFVVKDDQGRPLYLANITTDVTAQRQMEQDLRQARERADAANRAKSMFLANMSHEIRTPLNAVLGFTQVLLADREIGAEAHHRLEVILSAGNRLLGLINDVLDLAKIESGRMNLVLQPVDLQRELSEIADLFSARVAAKGLAWVADLSALPAPCTVQGDRTKIGQIVINLLGNALKFTEAGRIQLRAWRDGERAEQVWIEVEDSGPGMDDDELERLFSPFSQGQAGRDKGGSGLGLVLSRDMARAMGGELTLDSAPGAGTRARVMLPLPAVDAAPADPLADARIAHLDPATPCKVLVVEDDPDSRHLLVKLLQDIGCEVVACEDGQAGLDACRERAFDLVFSDIRMPRLTGVDMIRALRADPRTSALPVVAVTASSLEHERRFYIEIGFQDFVPKPYPFRDIYRMLAQYAGVRFVHDAEPAAATGAAPAPDGGGHATAGPAAAPAQARAPLAELQAAAAEGDLSQVKTLLAALDPAWVGPARQRAWEEAARRYDLQGLEAAVRDYLAATEADA
ncbi:MAG: ATP-binding protein [Burkholderiaceae bacterium]